MRSTANAKKQELTRVSGLDPLIMSEDGNGKSNAERLDVIVRLLRELVNRKRQQPKRLMRLKEASRYLSLSRWQLRRLIASGELTVVKVNDSGHAPFLLDRCDLDSWVERGKS